MSAADAPGRAGPYQLRKFKPNFEALGLVLEFLARKPPFADCVLGHVIPAVRYQIAMGEQWLRGGELRPGTGPETDAVALTIVRTDEPAALRHLIRACRNAGPGKRFFFKREYASGLRRTRYQSIRDIG